MPEVFVPSAFLLANNFTLPLGKNLQLAPCNFYCATQSAMMVLRGPLE
jgi:hypothetical protein